VFLTLFVEQRVSFLELAPANVELIDMAMHLLTHIVEQVACKIVVLMDYSSGLAPRLSGEIG
jgi:hypothetical protein